MDPITLKKIAKAAFPDYRGRTFRHDTSGSCTLMDLNWSGGSRSTYRAIRLADLAVNPGIGIAMPAPWDNPFEGKVAVVPDGFAIIQRSIFCGKDMGLRVYTAAQSTLEAVS